MAEATHRDLLMFVRLALRRDRSITAAQLLEAWQQQRAGAASEAELGRLRQLFEEEVAVLGERRSRVAAGPGMVPGFFLVLVANVAVLLLLAVLAADFPVATTLMVLIGVVQLIYVVPVGLLLRARKQSGALQGVIIGAGITFLLSAACFSLVHSFGGPLTP